MKLSDGHRELLLRYLLGELAEAECEALEVRLLSDFQFSQAMRETRDDLLDAYAAGELNAKQRERVQRALMSNAEQMQAARFAGVLRDHFAETGGKPVRKNRRSAWWIMGLIAAAVAIAISGGIYWRSLHMEQTQQVARAERPDTQAAPEQQRTDSQNDEPAFVLLLGAEQTRGGEAIPRVVIPAHLNLLEVQILLEPTAREPVYEVLVRGADGTKLPPLTGLIPSQLDSWRFLQFGLPVSDIKSEIYTFSVYSQTGAQAPLASYQARLLK